MHMKQGAALRVVVVGAGAAGIAAAQTLRSGGADVTVLEARSRAGGRAHTVELQPGVPVDLGAAWLHFADENVFTRLAREQGCSVIEREPDWGGRSRVGGRTPTAEEAAATGAAFEAFFGAVAEAAARGEDVPVASVLPDNPWRCRFDAVMTWAVGVESSQVSTVDLDRYADSRHDWAVREGLGQVVAAAAQGLDLRLSTPVRGLDLRARGVRVVTDRGSLEADAVVLTVPTPLLQEQALSIWPAPPPAWQQAAADLPLGVANKVFFGIAGGALGEGPTEHCVAHGDRSRTVHFALRPATQSVVMAYFGGDLSRELEVAGELESFARDALRDCLGADLAAAITVVRCTGWGNEPWSRGSYSAARPGRADARQRLSQPVGERLWYAGEACSVQHFGTLHGAWQSGCTAAREILALHGAST
ncbi:MAG: hypothetical protein RL026_2520 [Pseudomonadota bacterium]|jgi:monoamine oxidase